MHVSGEILCVYQGLKKGVRTHTPNTPRKGTAMHLLYGHFSDVYALEGLTCKPRRTSTFSTHTDNAFECLQASVDTHVFNTR